jgi:hypothetical protein
MKERGTTFDKVRDDEPVTCLQCSWSGFGRDLSIELFSELIEVNCPNCDRHIQILSFPTKKELVEEAAKGNQEAIDALSRLKRPNQRARRAAKKIRKSGDVPDTQLESFEVALTLDNSVAENPQLVMLIDGTEFWREPAYWEFSEQLCLFINAVASKFVGRMKTMEVSSELRFYASGDDLRGPGRIDAALMSAVPKRSS